MPKAQFGVEAKVDAQGEPRFLENVQMFLQRAAR